MATESWQVAFAADVQTAYGTVNATLRDLSGTIDETDGLVLGDRESGDGLSGISMPGIVRDSRQNADVAGTLIKQASSYQKSLIEGLQIAWHLKGNGVTSTPSTDQAKPDKGIDALLQGAGLLGSSGTSPDYNYDSDPTPIYLTVKLFDGPIAWRFQDCILESLVIGGTGGEVTLATASIKVGELIGDAPVTLTFPTVSYGNQSTLSAPSLVSAAHIFGASRDFQEASITIANDILEIPSANATGGQRLAQDGRTISISMLTEIYAADPDFDFTQLAKTAANTDDMSWRIGTASSATDTINGVSFDLRNLEVDSIKGDRAGDIRAQQIEAHCTSPSATSEFRMVFD